MLQTFSYLPVVVHRLNNYANYSTNLQQNYAQKNGLKRMILPKIKKRKLCRLTFLGRVHKIEAKGVT